MAPLVNVPVGEAKPGETAPRVNNLVKGGKPPISLPIGVKATTIYELINEMLDNKPNKKMMGFRELIDIHEEKIMVDKLIDGEMTKVEKVWQYYELSDYKYITCKELKTLVHNYGKGMIEMGMVPGVDKVHLFASTSAKWMQTFLAATTQSLPTVTAYDTLGEKGLTFSILQTETRAIFTDNALLTKLVNPLKKAEHIKYVIHSEEILQSDKRQGGKLYSEAKKAKDEILAVRPDIKFYSLSQLVKLGENSDKKEHPPTPKDVACIMYTSGSTGDPKGVVLSHKNVVAGVAGVGGIIDRSIINESDRVICFLPLAHIFELTFELLIFYWGGTIGYAGVKTLTEASMRNCLGDMRSFQPTIMVAVAAVWESVKKGILAKILKMPTPVQMIFWGAYKSKKFMTNYHIPGTSILDKLIFAKVKEATGGHLKMTLNGGSPISQETQEFITTLIAPLLIGYGLTETVANTTVLSPRRFEFGVAGALSCAIQVKLVDAEDLGYFAKNNQGEIWIKGDPVMVEYFKNEQETKATVTEDGWFKTGDIGEWSATGQLKVIDRKKNLVKTLNGEYVALEKIESIYRSNTVILNICCYADQTKVKPIAIVSPNPEVLRELAISKGIIKQSDNFDLEKMVHNKDLCKAVTQLLVAQGKKDGLAGIELILGTVLVDKEWTPQNGYVTSAHKLQRKKILADVQKEVDAVYSAN